MVLNKFEQSLKKKVLKILMIPKKPFQIVNIFRSKENQKRN